MGMISDALDLGDLGARDVQLQVFRKRDPLPGFSKEVDCASRSPAISVAKDRSKIGSNAPRRISHGLHPFRVIERLLMRQCVSEARQLMETDRRRAPGWYAQVVLR